MIGHNSLMHKHLTALHSPMQAWVAQFLPLDVHCLLVMSAVGTIHNLLVVVVGEHGFRFLGAGSVSRMYLIAVISHPIGNVVVLMDNMETAHDEGPAWLPLPAPRLPVTSTVNFAGEVTHDAGTRCVTASEHVDFRFPNTEPGWDKARRGS